MIVPMRDKPKNLLGEIPWLRIEDFDRKYVSNSKLGRGVSQKNIKKMNLKIFPVWTVLYSCNCAMGKTAIVKKPIITNQTFIGVVPDTSIDSISTGAIQTYLSREKFEKLKIPTPAIDEQQNSLLPRP